MKKNLGKILSILIILLAVVSGVLYYQIAKNGVDADKQIDTIINLTTWLLYITAILAVIGWILDIFSSKRSLVYTLISLAFLGLIVFFAYIMASGEPYKLGDMVYSGSVSKWVDTGLWTFYFLAIIAVVLMMFSWIYDYIKG